MTSPRFRFLGSAPVLMLIAGLLSAVPQDPAAAGPLVRRAQERKACEEFATKLKEAGDNTTAAQMTYQQGVLQLVSRFGENPCKDIPAPTSGRVAAPTAAPVAAPTTSAPAPTGSPAGAAPSAQQQQACQQFAGKLQSASASGGAAAAQQTYTMGLQKLTGMFGSNPCPSVKPPQ